MSTLQDHIKDTKKKKSNSCYELLMTVQGAFMKLTVSTTASGHTD